TLDAASASAKEQAISFISLGGPQQWRSQFHSTGPRKGGGRWLQLGHRFGSYARASQPRSPMWDRRFRRSLEQLPFRKRNPVARSAVADVATQHIIEGRPYPDQPGALCSETKERSTLIMENKKYIGMDVHQATISVAVRDSAGKLVMESIIETKAAMILQLIQGIHGSLWVTFEEG